MRTRLQRAWHRLPMFLGLALLFVPLFLWLLAQVPSLRSSVLALNGRPVLGIATPPMPAWPWQKEAGKRWAPGWTHRAEAWFNNSLPLYPAMVRMTNQINYSVFHASYMLESTIMRGQNEQIIARNYVYDYCNHPSRSVAKLDFNQWAQSLKHLQSKVESRGQAFVYLITPSKISLLPWTVPANIPCPDADSARYRYRAAVAALKAAGVPYVDGSAILLEKQRAGMPDDQLFPRGGIHWTTLAAAITAESVVKSIHYADGSAPQPLKFTSTLGGKPSISDTDLLDLANLLWDGPAYTVPVVSVVPSTPQQKRTLASVGGSFVDEVMRVLELDGQYEHMQYYNYFKAAHLNYPGRKHSPVDAAGAYSVLLDADIVLVEEHETSMPSDHLKELIQLFDNAPPRR